MAKKPLLGFFFDHPLVERCRAWGRVREICRKIDIPDVNEVALTKAEVKKAIFIHHHEDMKKEMEEKYTKLDDIKKWKLRFGKPILELRIWYSELGTQNSELRICNSEFIPWNL